MITNMQQTGVRDVVIHYRIVVRVNVKNLSGLMKVARQCGVNICNSVALAKQVVLQSFKHNAQPSYPR